MDNYREKFQELLRKLFQLDCADLDFGIYRIMNYKRDAIEKFIQKDLPKDISKELGKGALADQSAATKELEELKVQIRNTLTDDAIDEEGNLKKEHHNTKLGKRYLKLREKAFGAKPKPTLEATIFNHLYTFFSRYYDKADWMSLRRYSKKEKYAIPYNGEEVYLHWANKDQYYIKTGEYFTDYKFVSNEITVHFKLKQADVEQDNVKGDKRFFMPISKEASYDEKAKEIIIPVEYRPLNKQEAIRYGDRNQQDKVINVVLDAIPKQLKKANKALVALAAERRKTVDGKSVSFLEHHLHQYTRRNTSDFFIHKDLKGFLERELDFYIKNEVLSLDELEAGGEARVEGWFQMMKIVKAIGHKIIAFIAQIENFQKKLFEKKKFVTDTQYCIVVGNVAKKFSREIAKNEKQWEEWKKLLAIHQREKGLFGGKNKLKRRTDFLAKNPTLMLDTKHFDNDFVDQLLASFDALDEITDGLLIHGENLQALNLLLAKYRGKIKCIHIDPPYNTQTSRFLYKNSYQHSSWLAMMENRIAAAIPLMSPDGAYLCHIDENEYEALYLLCAHIGIPDGGTIVWDKKNPMLGRKGIATQHEYILWRTWCESPIYLKPTNVLKILAKAESLIQQHGSVNDEVRREFTSWISSCQGLTGGERAYRLINDDGRVFQSVAMGAPEPRTAPKFHIPLIHPVTKKKCPVPSNGWSRAPETLQELMEKDEILFGEDETVQPRRKVFLTEESKRQLSSVISDSKRGKTDVMKLGLEFPYCHPVSLYDELLGAAAPNSKDVVFDYFAGSGTTGHAVINLNREDGARREFILAEMDDCLDTILLPRIKKVTFSPEWKDGKPKRMATKEEAQRGPRIIKYFRIESYEDALNNIRFEDTKGGFLKFDDYLLDYMLDFETKGSETFLNIEKLSAPFSYKLLVHEEQETKEKLVDLPETFNYLLGLSVEGRRVCYKDKQRYLVYRGTVNHKKTVVIWRETEKWKKKDFEQDKKFVLEKKLTDGADEVFVNGDSFIPNAKALEPLFKSRMFAES